MRVSLRPSGALPSRGSSFGGCGTEFATGRGVPLIADSHRASEADSHRATEPPRSYAEASALLAAAARAGSRVVLAYHADADGTAAAALVVRAFGERGRDVLAWSPAKGENVYAPAFRERVAAAGPELVVLLDTGSRAGKPFGDVPTLVIDHHAAPAPPDVDVFVTGAGDDVSASWLTWQVLSETFEVTPHDWLAALGLLGDRGDHARGHPIVHEASRRFGIGRLKTAVALVNAAGRSAEHDSDCALRALAAASGPRDLVEATGPDAARLHALRAQVNEALGRARRAPPRVQGRWAVIRIEEPCRVHGPVAEMWTGRLRDKIVLVANSGYVSGRVHFVVRSRLELNLRKTLLELVLDAGPDYAAGHDRATGGIVSNAVFDQVLEAIRRESAGLTRAAS